MGHAPLGKNLIQQPAQLMQIKLSRALAQSVLWVYHDHIGKLHLLHLFVEDQDRNMLGSVLLGQHGVQCLYGGQRIVQQHRIWMHTACLLQHVQAVLCLDYLIASGP